MSNPNTNYNTGTTYNSWDDVDRDMDNHPACRDKIEAFARRLGAHLTHEQIRINCNLWGCQTIDQFWKIFNRFSDDQLKKLVSRLNKGEIPADLSFQEVKDILGAANPDECADLIDKMSDSEFSEFVKRIKRKRKNKGQEAKVEVPVYA